ncbi:MAG: ATP-binding protein [Gammaproteobacteria bacterium]
MTQRSLRFRLLASAGVSVIVALLIAGMSLTVIFEHHVKRRIGTELETYLKQIVAGISLMPDGRVTTTAALADPRFDQPISGLYWQVQDEQRPRLLRSRSLWDDVITLPDDRLAPGTVHEHDLPGPAGQSLLVRERQIVLRHAGDERRIRIIVATDKRSLAEARNAFAADMLPYLAVMAAVLLAAAWIQVRIGLAPLDDVRRGVMEIRSGTSCRLESRHPDEVMPLVDEINGLLEAQEKTIERARAWTADLAHGLKTPLSVLTADAQRLRDEGSTSIADDLDQLAETMRRRVDRELIRARVRSGVQSRRVRAEVAETVNRIVRTLKRTPRGSVLQWNVEAPGGVDAAILADDLADLLGNILENAAKWANGMVAVAVATGNGVIITVEDDGPGVPAGQLDNLGLRGMRLDEQKQGTGLGLAIARDIVEAYHGDLLFSHAPTGGLAVVVRLPAAT